MKRILALGMSTVLAVPLLSTAVVMAENTNSGSVTGSNGTNNTQTTATPPKPATDQPTTVAATDTTKPASNDDAKALQTRLDQRKTELKVKLSAVEKLNIQNKCKPAQGLVSSIKERIQGAETGRTAAYTNIVAKLTDLSAKLKNKGADTKTLDADITVLQAKITTFSTDLATYKQAVSDLAAVDCKTDPDGFKASLQAARTNLELVNKDAVAIRGYVNDTIKPELKTIRDVLDKSTTGGN